MDFCRDGRLRFSVGFDLTEPVRTAILALCEDAWVPALTQAGEERDDGAWVAEITDAMDLTGWPDRSRVLVRRERPHPGAQLSFTDHDGHRFQAILTDQPDTDIAYLEARHRGHARVEDRIKAGKDTGMAKLPIRPPLGRPAGAVAGGSRSSICFSAPWRTTPAVRRGPWLRWGSIRRRFAMRCQRCWSPTAPETAGHSSEVSAAGSGCSERLMS